MKPHLDGFLHVPSAERLKRDFEWSPARVQVVFHHLIWKDVHNKHNNKHSEGLRTLQVLGLSRTTPLFYERAASLFPSVCKIPDRGLIFQRNPAMKPMFRHCLNSTLLKYIKQTHSVLLRFYLIIQFSGLDLKIHNSVVLDFLSADLKSDKEIIDCNFCALMFLNNEMKLNLYQAICSSVLLTEPLSIFMNAKCTVSEKKKR